MAASLSLSTPQLPPGPGGCIAFLCSTMPLLRCAIPGRVVHRFLLYCQCIYIYIFCFCFCQDPKRQSMYLQRPIYKQEAQQVANLSRTCAGRERFRDLFEPRPVAILSSERNCRQGTIIACQEPICFLQIHFSMQAA